MSSAKCASCGKTAYATEQVKTDNHTFHKQCFKCWSCKTSLAKGKQNNGKDGYPYCAKCYGSLFGPTGFRGTAMTNAMDSAQYDTKSHQSDAPVTFAIGALGGSITAPSGGGAAAKKFCDQCGGALSPGQKFCPGCGSATGN